MHINSLPYDILLPILRPICEEEHYRAKHWVNRLNLLAVCQVWRCMALPLVYKTISIEYAGNVFTNADLVTEKMVDIPRALNIWISFNNNGPIPCLELVLEKIQTYKNILSNVNYLYIQANFADIRVDDYEEDEDENEEETVPDSKHLSKVASNLQILLPNIKTYLSHINIADETGLALERALVQQFASQVRKMEASSLALNSSVKFSNSLSALSIWSYPDSIVTTRVDTTSLTRLELSGIDGTFDWSIFTSSTGSNPHTLSFPALEYLFVDVWFMPEDIGNQSDDVNENENSNHVYEQDGEVNDENNIIIIDNENNSNNEEDEDEDEDEENESSVPRSSFNFIFEAPRLYALRIRMCPFSCSFLASIRMSKPLAMLEIITLNGINMNFFDFDLNASKNVFLEYYNKYATNGRVNDVMLFNDLQAIHRLPLRNISARIDGPIENIIKNINWPQVTSLYIHSLISVKNLMNLISYAVPNLVSLKAVNIKVKEQDNGLLVIPEQQFPSLSNPNFCRIKSIEYGFAIQSNALQDLSNEFSAYMFNTIKSLKYCVFCTKKHGWKF